MSRRISSDIASRRASRNSISRVAVIVESSELRMKCGAALISSTGAALHAVLRSLLLFQHLRWLGSGVRPPLIDIHILVQLRDIRRRTLVGPFHTLTDLSADIGNHGVILFLAHAVVGLQGGG